MKQKLFLLDLAACSLWALAVLGSRHCLGGIPANPVVVLAVVSRITLAFTLYRKEKRSWVPLLLFMGLTFLVIAGDTDSGIHNLTRYPFAILGLAYDYPTGMVIRIAWLIWLGMVPVITYLALLVLQEAEKDNPDVEGHFRGGLMERWQGKDLLPAPAGCGIHPLRRPDHEHPHESFYVPVGSDFELLAAVKTLRNGSKEVLANTDRHGDVLLCPTHRRRVANGAVRHKHSFCRIFV